MQNSMSNLKCNICGGRMHNGFTIICACEATPITKVENVPAYVCEVCGESVITGATLRTIERIRSGDIVSRTEPCRVIDFNDAMEDIGEPWIERVTAITNGTSGQSGSTLHYAMAK